MYVDDDGQQVEEILVQRVVSAAQRRRARRAVVGGLLVIVTAGGVALGLTHRSGAAPSGGLTLTVHHPPVDAAARAEIYAVARARYAYALDGAGSRTPHLEFGRLVVTADRATLRVNFVCVPLCGHGEELTLAKQDGSWRVVAVRTTWVS